MNFAKPPVLSDSLTNVFSSGSGLTPALSATSASLLNPLLASSRASAIAFIDASVSDYQTLVAGIAPGTEVHVLDSSQDAITQITNTLLGRHNISSLHIVSHGEAGGLDFGSSVLNLTDLPQYAAQLQSWSNALTDDADLLLYGCNVAQGELGKAFVSILSQLTGADVAASGDLTGNSTLGGNWTLEYQSGDIETVALAAANYHSVLANFTVTNTSDSGVGSLRDAISQANSLAGADTITFDATTFATAQTIRLQSELVINSDVSITGTGQSNLTINGDANNSGTNDVGDVRVLFINSGTVTLQDLTVAGGRAQGGKGGNGYDGGGGGAGLGGGLLVNNGNVTLNRVVFNNNQAIGGAGGAGVTSQIYAGGGGGGVGGNGSNTSGGPGSNISSGGSGGSGGSFGGSGGSGGQGSSVGNSAATNGGTGAGGGGGAGVSPYNINGNGGNGGFGGGGGGTYYNNGGNGGFGGGGGSGGSASGLGGSFGGNGTNGGGGLGGGGGAGLGGAVFVRAGSLSLDTVTFTNNSAFGGVAGGFRAQPGQGQGGAVFVFDGTPNPNGNNDGIPATTPTASGTNVFGSGNTAANGGGSPTTNNGFGINFAIVPPNALPTSADKAVTFNEDTVYTFSQTDFAFNDTDGGTFTSVKITQLPSAGQLFLDNNSDNLQGTGEAIAPNQVIAVADLGKLKFNPAANANGSSYASFQFQVNDGISFSTAYTTTLNVTAVNDAPVLTDTNVVLAAVNEDAGAPSGAVGTLVSTIVNTSNVTDADIPSGFIPGIALTAADTSNGTWLYSTDGTTWNALGAVSDANARLLTATDRLYFQPNANYNGTIANAITFRAWDQTSGNNGDLGDTTGSNNGGNTAFSTATDTASLTVTAINDAPSFTKGADQTIDEDAGAQSINSWATNLSAGAANESGQTLTFLVSNNNNALFGVQPTIDATGKLTYSAAANASGTATVTVSLQDNGGTMPGVDTSAPQTFTIAVNAVNDAPSFTKGVDQVVNEDAGAQSIAWATNLSTGATNESSQTLSFVVSNNNTALFASQPTISAAGLLTYTPTANASGTATVTVQLQDDGGTANGGIATAAAQTFTITVNPVNDAPSLTGNATLPAITQNTTNPSGGTITSLFGSLFSDVDTGASFSGLAIRGNIANASTEGQWQYSTDGTTWASVGTVADGVTALVLSASTLLRFVPVAGYNGTPGGLTVRALDNTYSGGFSTNSTRITVNTTNNGGSSAIAATFSTLTTSVTQLLPGLVWRNSNTGQTAAWQLNGYTIQTSYFLPTVEASWQIVSSTADFNADGVADLLWRNQVTGSNAIWQMSSAGYQTGYFITPVADVNWQIVGTADFNRDNSPDIVWRHNKTGENAIWEMNNFALQSGHFLTPVVDTNWQIVGIANFTSEGTPDLLWRHNKTGENAIWEMNNFALQSGHFLTPVADANWQIVGIGNFNGDATPDIVWRHKATGVNAIWEMNGVTLQSGHFIDSLADTNWQIAGVADLGGDSTSEILWRNKQSAKDMIWQLSGFSYAQTHQLPDVTPEWSVKPFGVLTQGTAAPLP